MPISLKIEPSAMCQLVCPGCPQSNPLFKIQTRGQLMSMRVFEQILSNVGNYLYRIQFYDYGEPFLNKQLLNMISLATARNIGSQVSTNFSFPFRDDFYREIVGSGLEHLIIAMDGITSESYSRYRVNGKYELVEHGLRQILHWKQRLRNRFPVVEWQFIIFDHNRHEIDTVKAMAREIGVDRLCLKYDAGASPLQWTPGDRFKDRAVRKFRLHSCLWLWGALLIDYEGTVHPCCNSARRDTIGNLTITPVREIWNCNRMKELRDYVRQQHDDIHCMATGPRAPCQGCPHIM
jgi:radical SAM protein with 4Fe4S-binding SPASM domain